MSSSRLKNRAARKAKEDELRTYGPVPLRYRGVRFPEVYWIAGEPWFTQECISEFIGKAELDSVADRYSDLVWNEKWSCVPKNANTNIAVFSLIGVQLLFGLCRFADALVISRIAELLQMQKTGNLKPLLPTSEKLRLVLRLLKCSAGNLHDDALREIAAQMGSSLVSVRRWRAGFELSGYLDDNTIRPRRNV